MNDVVRETSILSAGASVVRGRVLTVVNLLIAFMSTVSAILALADPGILLSGAVNATTEFYTQAYAARAIPLGIAVFAVFCVRALRTRPAVLVVLSVAGLAQVGDLAIGATQGIPGMMFGSAVSLIAHLGSVAWILRTPASR